MAQEVSPDKWYPDIKCLVRAAHVVAANNIGYGQEEGNFICTSFANAVIGQAARYDGWTGVLDDGYVSAMYAVSYGGGLGKHGKWTVYSYGAIDPWPGDLLGWHPGDNPNDLTAGHVGWVIGYGGPVAEAVGSGPTPDFESIVVYEKTSPDEDGCNKELKDHTQKTIRAVSGKKSDHYQTKTEYFWVEEKEHTVYTTKYYKKTSSGLELQISWKEYNDHKGDPNYYSRTEETGKHKDLVDKEIEYYLDGKDSGGFKAELGDQGGIETIDTGSAGGGRNWKYIARNWSCWDGIDHFEDRGGGNERYQIPP